MKIKISVVDEQFRWPELQKDMIKKEGGAVIGFVSESHKDAEILNVFRMHFLNILERSPKGKCNWSKILEVVSDDGSETGQINIHIYNSDRILSSCLVVAGKFVEIFGKACEVHEDCVKTDKIMSKKV